MKRLFEVTIEKTLYVMAEDESEAELEARTAEAEETPDVSSCREIKGIEQVPEEWRDSLPWNDAGDKTVRQILELPEPPAPPYDDPNQIKLDFPTGGSGC